MSDEPKTFTEEECRITHLMGWYNALTTASTSTRMNKPQREILKFLAYPKLQELEDLGVHPVGGRDNPDNAEYYEWLDAR